MNSILLPEFKRTLSARSRKIDCSKLCKNDAYGELFSVSKIEIAKWPVVIIENITEIPEEDDVHYNPRLVENLLLHGWKESTRHLTNPNRGDFTLETHNYAVLIIWDASRKEKMKTIGALQMVLHGLKTMKRTQSVEISI